MSRFYINKDDLFRIHRIDRETAYYWHELCHDGDDERWSRSKKQYTDLVFDSFGEAKAEMVRRFSVRLANAQAMTGARNEHTRLGEEPRV
jgi:hypothetical protein